MPLSLLHKISGMIFLILAIVAAYEAYIAAQKAEWWINFIG
jgi:putative Ca2+/H+ antiporter (TMEM165/GDT1 family)